MTNLEEQKVAYTELLEVLDKHKVTLKGNSCVSSTLGEVRNKLEWIRVLTEFKLYDINPDILYGKGWAEVGGYQGLNHFYEGSNKSIGWEDEGRQPENEWLYIIRFPTGPFIYGDSYPTGAFRAMFQELKSYGPKYCDSSNKVLYFSAENAYKVHSEVGTIIEKHRESVDAEMKSKEIEELKAKLVQLEELERGAGE